MAQPSILRPVGGPLAGQSFEFYGTEVLIGTAPECGVRVDAPGVAEQHARIVIEITGATILRVDGIVGVNDDVVLGDSLLRSGDFVWLGEPGGPTSLMLQFTLGDGEPAVETAAATVPSVEPPIEAEHPAPLEMPAEEAALAEAPVEESAAYAEVVEMAPEGLEASRHLEEPAALEAAPVEEAAVEEFAEPMLPESLPAEEAPFEEAPYEEPQSVEPARFEEAPPEFERPEIEPVAEIESMAEAPPELETAAEIESVAEIEQMAGAEAAMAAEAPPEFEPAGSESAAEIESIAEIETDIPAPDDLAPVPTAAPAPARSVPPAPWLVPASSEAVARPATEYASSWEQPPKAPLPAPEEQEETVVAPSAQAASARPTAPPVASAPPVAKPAPPVAPAPPPRRPAAARTQAASTPKPNPRTGPLAPPPPRPEPSSAPKIVGALVALVVLGVSALIMLRPAETPAPPPTPVPTAVVTETPAPVAPTPEPLPTQVAMVEPSPEPPPVAAPPAPTPRAGTTPSPRATPTPRTTPTPRATPTSTPRPGTTAAPTPVATVAAPAAPVSQAPKLLEDARAAIAAKDLARADQILDQVLRLEPGNAEASTRKAEVAARLATLARKFVMGVTTVIGGKAAKGPTGFDLGGGGAVKTEFSAQIRCTSTPAVVEEGTPYTVRCAIVNIGNKAFKLESVAANEIRDGAKSAGSGTPPRGDLAPQSEGAIVEKAGTWSAKSQWSLEIVAKTNKDESFRAVLNWR